MSEIEIVKVKNQKRVEAGKKGAEARKIKAALKITNDENEEKRSYKNYIPLFAVIVGIIGLGIYTINRPETKPKEVLIGKKEIDPFEFN